MAAHQISWENYLIIQILQDDNPFSQQVQKPTINNLNHSLVAAAKHDLKVLQIVYHCNAKTIKKWFQKKFNNSKNLVVWDWKGRQNNSFLERTKNWEKALEELANYYREKGTGIG